MRRKQARTCLIVAMVVVAVATGCGLVGQETAVEAVRLSGVGGRVDAVVIEASAGATTTYSYRVYLVAAGTAATGDPVVTVVGGQRSPVAYGVDLEWTGADAITVSYWQADSVSPSRRALDVRIGGDHVAVTVVAGIENRSAPPGMMASPS